MKNGTETHQLKTLQNSCYNNTSSYIVTDMDSSGTWTDATYSESPRRKTITFDIKGSGNNNSIYSIYSSDAAQTDNDRKKKKTSFKQRPSISSVVHDVIREDRESFFSSMPTSEGIETKHSTCTWQTEETLQGRRPIESSTDSLTVCTGVDNIRETRAIEKPYFTPAAPEREEREEVLKFYYSSLKRQLEISQKNDQQLEISQKNDHKEKSSIRSSLKMPADQSRNFQHFPDNPVFSTCSSFGVANSSILKAPSWYPKIKNESSLKVVSWSKSNLSDSGYADISSFESNSVPAQAIILSHQNLKDWAAKTFRARAGGANDGRAAPLTGVYPSELERNQLAMSSLTEGHCFLSDDNLTVGNNNPAPEVPSKGWLSCNICACAY